MCPFIIVQSLYQVAKIINRFAMKRLYLGAAILGTALPYYYLISFLFDHGFDVSLMRPTSVPIVQGVETGVAVRARARHRIILI
jgi:hypothetical protein